MQERPLRTTVIGSYPFPGWLLHASENLDSFGPDDVARLTAAGAHGFLVGESLMREQDVTTALERLRRTT